MTGIVDGARLLAQMTGYNPWWVGKPQRLPSFRRVAFHRCLERLTDSRSRRAVLLSGPRRVGKSTILNQIAQELIAQGNDPKSILYLSLDDNLLKLAALPELLEIFHESILPEGQSAYLLLDEVHFSTDWDSHLKTFIDHRPEYRILATGSASIEHRQRTADSGVGRWVTISIPTLSFYEYLRLIERAPGGIDTKLKASDLHRASAGTRALLASTMRATLPSFKRYLLTGGFPETAKITDVAECQRLIREDIVDKVLKRDVTALFGVRLVADLERLFLYVCLHSGGIVNASTCASELGLSRSTVDDHLDILVRSNLLYRVGPFARGGKKILKARYKYYLVDAALRNAILLSGEAVLQDVNEMGRVVETAVLRHLFAFHYRDLPTISYWLDSRTKKEVDIIVQHPSYTIPVEVKYRDSANVEANSGLAIFCAEEKVRRAFMVTRRDVDFDIVQPTGSSLTVLRIPAHIFTYLVGQAEQHQTSR